jgi:hypothetical protein
MTVLFWHRIDRGVYGSQHGWHIRHSEHDGYWHLYRSGHPIGFRPTLAEAKALAESMTPRTSEVAT